MILLTGANGFIGQHLLAHMSVPARVLGRTQPINFSGEFVQEDLEQRSDFSAVLADVDVVVHCAARVPLLGENPLQARIEFNCMNVETTLALAREAANQGVRRFIFLSSIKVNGDSTTGRGAFTAEDVADVSCDYGRSKYEAERQLLALADNTSMEVVIVRPPLVYGPGVKGNFLSLMKLAKSGLPLPFGTVRNKRSMVYVGNLVDFIGQLIETESSVAGVYLISDDDDLSTTDLMTALREAMAIPRRLLPISPVLFQWFGCLLGKREIIDRLFGSLVVDIESTKQRLDWKPPFSTREGIGFTVKNFLNKDESRTEKG